ncbi:type II toxin-antitoxin system VapB family antitoxin [Chitinophaga sp. 22321]|uniref:Type II toxin-antitoxin system VapB family antitoxin n=1 Tax=Chitinophaga hostae TaxID=2831022 RepID=A0ABS5ITP2_9BACT|nr:type II toxin-antitoxin system VapB family antitoxin [Chitinophaga hostae]MBS0026330.1 type II toxin-antitoxin system VapB family antitoxin [Chitinophaga hostae]
MAKARSNINQANIVNLNPELIKEAMKLNKGKTKEEVINEALRKFILGINQRKFLDLQGKIYWDGDLNEMRGK